MPQYLGRGKDFYLIFCELMPSSQASKEEKLKIIQERCHNCGYFKDALARREQALLDHKPWRKLVCIHPQNKSAFEKFKGHVTEWAK